MLYSVKAQIAGAYESRRTLFLKNCTQGKFGIESVDAVVMEASTNRPIFVLKNRAYYVSTGENSGHPNTVFPFYGVQIKSSSLWFVKPKICEYIYAFDLLIKHCNDHDSNLFLLHKYKARETLKRILSDLIQKFFENEKQIPIYAVLKKISEDKRLESEEKNLFFESKSFFEDKLKSEIDVLFGEKIRKILFFDAESKETLARFGDIENLIVSYLVGDGIWNDPLDPYYHRMRSVIEILNSDYSDLLEQKRKNLTESGLDVKIREIIREQEEHQKSLYFKSNNVVQLPNPESINQFLFMHNAFVRET